ncbi:outer membrane protein OmpA [Vibrio orientalis CIP 102891 = ATCC 33934]|uniref:Outer membrane protein A n=2 Tax=Vibrio orientalis TaxID=28175 RepID=C9QFT2_VIBOR|nr:OmpA family protein [Vibrio orientalis]EEX94223.1 outer membrane protein A precursor [Vibrio orientalis CIP 102891 = ATCC 33934]EGU44463.1 outer membrane protein OmpA [Vibrio orientalis CIP 102891 = ATCC 33934]
MQKRMIFSLLTVALFSSLACASTDFYTGLGLGMSNLSPDINQQEQDDQRKFAGTLFLGKNIGSYTALEGSYSYLSSYDLNDNDGAVEYQNYGLSGLLYWPSSSSEWSVYGKLGANYLDANFQGSAANLNVEHKVSFASGLGIRWNLNENWFARLEYNLYDSDYSAAFIQVARTWGHSSEQAQLVEIQTDSVIEEPMVTEQHPQSITKSEMFDKVTLSSGPFDSESSELNESSSQQLSQLVATLKEYPEAKVEVVGHTDSTGSSSYNQALSIQRATEVSNFLESEGIDSSRISIDGHGETQPIAPNSTSQGRANNRRVEVTIPQFEFVRK